MIKVKIKCDNGSFESIDINGHANHGDYGYDIVCASVSSIVITSINAIIRLDKDAISYKDNDGISIKVLKHNNTVDTLILNMVSLLSELENEYKKNIMISEEV